MSSDWDSYGRIDADGTVYVKTAAGERAVGSWHAGSPEEGLAHFTRRFADLVTEVDLIEARLNGGVADPGQAATSARRLRDQLAGAHAVGDLDGLALRLDKLATVADEKIEHQRAERQAARAEAVARKTALVEEAEQLAAESTSWKSAGDRLRTIVEEWREVKGVDKKTDSQLWKRYATARDTFTRRRGTHFATLDSARKEAQATKEALLTEAEKVSDSTDWTGTADHLKELMAQWKAAPRASREIEQRLWERFRAAQDNYFTRRSEAFATRELEQKQHLQQRQELLAQAEALDVDADPRAAQQQLRDIQTRWQSAGKVRRESVAALERRLRAVEEKVRSAMNAGWQRSGQSANPLLAQIREQVAEAQERLDRARAAGDTKRITEAQDALDSRRQVLKLAERSS